MRQLSFAAIVLAAGRGTRMIGRNKLLAEISGKPIVRHAVEAAVASRANKVIVVTGHDSEPVRDALQGLEIEIVHNADYEHGLSTSLRKGIASVQPEMDAALILLGDMPFITPGLIDELCAAFEKNPEALVVAPTHNGQRGNPAMWRRSLFGALQDIKGDIGARDLMKRYKKNLVELSVSSDAVLADIDTNEELARRLNRR